MKAWLNVYKSERSPCKCLSWQSFCAVGCKPVMLSCLDKANILVANCFNLPQQDSSVTVIYFNLDSCSEYFSRSVPNRPLEFSHIAVVLQHLHPSSVFVIFSPLSANLSLALGRKWHMGHMIPLRIMPFLNNSFWSLTACQRTKAGISRRLSHSAIYGKHKNFFLSDLFLMFLCSRSINYF